MNSIYNVPQPKKSCVECNLSITQAEFASNKKRCNTCHAELTPKPKPKKKDK